MTSAPRAARAHEAAQPIGGDLRIGFHAHFVAQREELVLEVVFVDFEDDPRNERILIWVNGELVTRERAVVSVFDAGFVLGDGVWEGLRVRAGTDRVPPTALLRELAKIEHVIVSRSN